MNTLTGQLNNHIYVYVDSTFIINDDEPKRAIEAVWFGLTSTPGRSWGCTLMLESGAVYRNIPPHAIMFNKEAWIPWTIKDAANWDCYAYEWTTVCYDYLRDLQVKTIGGHEGRYLFSTSHVKDGYTLEPEQNKEMSWIKLNNGRLAVRPTHEILFKDASFTSYFNKEWEFPTNLKVQKDVYRSE